MPQQTLVSTSTIYSLSDTPPRVRPEGDGWVLKTEQKTWNHHKNEGTVKWTWERVVDPAE